VAGPAVGSLLVRVGGQEAPGLAAAALSLVVSVFAWRYLRESRELRASGAFTAVSPTTGRAAIRRVLSRWHEPAPRLIWIYAVAIGAFYGTIQTVPLLLQRRMGITEENIGWFVMYLGGMGVVVRSLILGPAVDRLGEARLSRLGLVLLAGGLAATGLARGWGLLALGFTLVPGGERGLYMGVQHTFGGISRVAFPIAAGVMMDTLGVGVPFWIAGLLVLVTLPLTRAMDTGRGPEPPEAVEARNLAAADLTAEYPVEPTPGGGTPVVSGK
jgi:MFS family permease